MGTRRARREIPREHGWDTFKRPPPPLSDRLLVEGPPVAPFLAIGMSPAAVAAGDPRDYGMYLDHRLREVQFQFHFRFRW